MLVLGEDRREQGTAATRDVDDLAEPTEVVGVEDGGVDDTGDGRHRAVEDRELLGPLRAVRPDVRAMDKAEGVLARSDALDQGGPRVPMHRTADHQRPAVDASGY